MENRHSASDSEVLQNINMKKISNGTVDLIGKDRSPVKVCDVINGRPKVTQIIDLRLSEEVRAENCSDFSYIFQSCGRIVHKFYGII